MKNSRLKTKMTIHLPFTANTAAKPRPMTRSSILITPIAKVAPSLDLDMDMDTNGGMAWIPMTRASDWEFHGCVGVAGHLIAQNLHGSWSWSWLVGLALLA
jgi:hypothetical protein